MKKRHLVICAFSLLFGQEAYGERWLQSISFNQASLEALGLSKKSQTSLQEMDQTFTLSIDDKNEFERRLEQFRPRFKFTTSGGYKVLLKLSNKKKEILQFEVRF